MPRIPCQYPDVCKRKSHNTANSCLGAKQASRKNKTASVNPIADAELEVNPGFFHGATAESVDLSDSTVESPALSFCSSRSTVKDSSLDVDYLHLDQQAVRSEKFWEKKGEPAQYPFANQQGSTIAYSSINAGEAVIEDSEIEGMNADLVSPTGRKYPLKLRGAKIAGEGEYVQAFGTFTNTSGEAQEASFEANPLKSGHVEVRVTRGEDDDSFFTTYRGDLYFDDFRFKGDDSHVDDLISRAPEAFREDLEKMAKGVARRNRAQAAATDTSMRNQGAANKGSYLEMNCGRALQVENADGVTYIPFDGKNLTESVREKIGKKYGVTPESVNSYSDVTMKLKLTDDKNFIYPDYTFESDTLGHGRPFKVESADDL